MLYRPRLGRLEIDMPRNLPRLLHFAHVARTLWQHGLFDDQRLEMVLILFIITLTALVGDIGMRFQPAEEHLPIRTQLSLSPRDVQFEVCEVSAESSSDS